VWISNIVCEGKPKMNLHQCSNCSQLENQLKEALNELSSVKLTMDILNEETKFLKQISPIDSNAGNSWLMSKSRNSSSLTTLRPSKETHTTHITLITTRYAVPVTNRYAVLTNHHEQQVSNDRISFSKIEQPPKFRTTNNYKNVKEL
jgi:hypothetical protein